MDVKDFAEFVINNMGRATLSNALNISGKLNGGDYYELEEFITSINECVSKQLSSGKLSNDVAYRILAASSVLTKKITSTFKYNRQMLADDYIIEIWRAINGH